MIQELVQLIEEGKLKEPDAEVVKLSGNDEEVTAKAREALRRSADGSAGKKLLFKFSP
jgi:hypothetical protein